METTEGTSTHFTDALVKCGSELPVSHKLPPHAVHDFLAGLVYWLETGSVEPPKPVEQTQETVTSKDAEIAQLRAELSAAEAQQAPIAVPAPPATPPSSQSPATTPTAPQESVTGTAPAPAVPVPTTSPAPVTPPANPAGDVPSVPAS